MATREECEAADTRRVHDVLRYGRKVLEDWELWTAAEWVRCRAGGGADLHKQYQAHLGAWFEVLFPGGFDEFVRRLRRLKDAGELGYDCVPLMELYEALFDAYRRRDALVDLAGRALLGAVEAQLRAVHAAAGRALLSRERAGAGRALWDVKAWFTTAVEAPQTEAQWGELGAALCDRIDDAVSRSGLRSEVPLWCALCTPPLPHTTDHYDLVVILGAAHCVKARRGDARERVAAALAVLRPVQQLDRLARGGFMDALGDTLETLEYDHGLHRCGFADALVRHLTAALPPGLPPEALLQKVVDAPEVREACQPGRGAGAADVQRARWHAMAWGDEATFVKVAVYYKVLRERMDTAEDYLAEYIAALNDAEGDAMVQMDRLAYAHPEVLDVLSLRGLDDDDDDRAPPLQQLLRIRVRDATPLHHPPPVTREFVWETADAACLRCCIPAGLAGSPLHAGQNGGPATVERGFAALEQAPRSIGRGLGAAASAVYSAAQDPSCPPGGAEAPGTAEDLCRYLAARGGSRGAMWNFPFATVFLRHDASRRTALLRRARYASLAARLKEARGRGAADGMAGGAPPTAVAAAWS